MLSPGPVTIAPAGAAEAEAIAQLHASLFAQPWSRASIAGLLAHPAALAFVARFGQAPADPEAASPLAGFVLGQMAADQVELLSIGVGATYQRSGAASALLNTLGAVAVRGGATRVFLEVAEDNSSALALYGSLGFVEAGRRRGYYDRHSTSATINALILSKSLETRAMHGLALSPDL